MDERYQRGYCLICWNAFNAGVNMGRSILQGEIAELLGIDEIDDRLKEVEHGIRDLNQSGPSRPVAARTVLW